MVEEEGLKADKEGVMFGEADAALDEQDRYKKVFMMSFKYS